VEDLIINDAKKFIGELMAKNDPSHDFAHVERVYNNALEIANSEVKNKTCIKIDMLVIKLAALFHDICDFKYEKIENFDDLKYLTESRLSGFFKKHNIPAKKVDSILYIISNMSFRKELEGDNIDLTPEFMIVRDSDRLDAIGAIGIARCFGFSCQKKLPFYIKGVKPLVNMTTEEYNNQTKNNLSNAYNHFYEKLLLLKDRMLTNTGKILAEKRHEFMKQFLENFKSEVGL
ncbi:hypothetical protein H312_00362, partial [Anncaliia algerae PRA339]